jgi:hypothetical protein
LHGGAPLADGSFSAMVFVDSKTLSMRSRDSLEIVYRHLLGESHLLLHCLHGELITPVRACDATCRRATSVVGHDWIRTGEAAFSIDPLSSQGVQAALRTGLQAATVVHTILSKPGHTRDAEQFYRQSCDETVKQQAAAASRFYAEIASSTTSSFWKARAANMRSDTPSVHPAAARLPSQLNVPLRLSRHARRIAVPLMKDNLIVSGPALAHPGFERPCGFVAGVAIDELLAPLKDGILASALIRAWSSKVPHVIPLRKSSSRMPTGLIHSHCRASDLPNHLHLHPFCSVGV